MVCLSAAVMTKGGKVLLARQFVEMTRMRIENHLATFPKVMGADKQHNTVETGEVRYVYQPVEALMLVLVTNKHSNIVEDLEMLRLFAKVLNEYCPGEVDEANVCKNAFEIIFAFDEVVALGHRENVTMRDIQVNMEMESHEEKLANMIRQSKEREAAEEAKRRAKTIATERRRGDGKGGGMGSMGGMGSTPMVETNPMGGGGMGEGMGMAPFGGSDFASPAPSVRAAPAPPRRPPPARPRAPRPRRAAPRRAAARAPTRPRRRPRAALAARARARARARRPTSARPPTSRRTRSR